MFRLPRAVSCALLALALAGFFNRAAAQPIDLGVQRELFVDRFLIEETRGVELRLHSPVKAPRPKSPLPERHMATVIKDGGLYRAWYRSNDPAYKGEMHTGHSGESIHYAESRDGHEWTFPKLGLHEYDGSRDNNVILARMPPYLTNFMLFLDTRPGVPAAERYKAVAGYPGGGNKLGLKKAGIGLYGFVSPDGIKWTKQQEIIPYRPEWRHAFDSPNVAFWSEAEQLYVCYFRTWSEPDRLRTVSRATSPDFVRWSDPVEMKPNLPGEHLYTTHTQPYVRAPHIYIAVPTRFVPLARDSADSVEKNVTDVLFMSTRAGATRYDRPFTEAFIRPGLDVKQWTNRANYVANNVVQTAPDELSIYHRSGDRYVLRVDGFASLHAGGQAGEMLTKQLKFSGRKLLLNFSGSAVGSVRVDILDPAGKLLAASEPLTGDSIEQDVVWRAPGDLAKLAGKPVRLRFTLRDVDLYALRFAE
ncbi:MAG: hypothetical protein V4773_26335 [Verrucomicrobiota bacterium]